MKKVIISLVAFASLGFGDTDNHWLKAVEEICENLAMHLHAMSQV